ncbi:hypothetical protein BKA82DRAFT_1002794 [Pisolithus tinctorius]|uniref:Uncharacterized protein n=1 Tax=Pisolithus tinctorius Marx 270 TaxID=870435 RepID=A0A0C3P2F2_PISTI|nr:hypothetical protein BKA82DRAFT_1002794 [Pisolithus tinctorius]KIO01666.1 hypothetical protein M404DRAFT_1002794 [Pisolithus tinctorius Marx 270]
MLQKSTTAEREITIKMEKKIAQLQEEKKKSSDSSATEIHKLYGVINQLAREGQELRQTKVLLRDKVKHLTTRLKEKENECAISERRLHLAMRVLSPLRHRILMDYAKQKISYSFTKTAWKKLIASQLPTSELAIRIKNKLEKAGESQTPSVKDLAFLFSMRNSLRKKGNKVAHHATRAELRDAVLTLPTKSRHRLFLESLFRFIFKRDLNSPLRK